MLEHRIVYEEVPGSRTTQETMIEPQRERIAYEELQVGDHIQDGDQWQNDNGRWQPFSVAPIQVQQGSRVRRPYKISTILEIGDALASAQAAATQLQAERDEARLAIAQVKAAFNTQAEVLAELRADEKRLVDNLDLLRREYLKVQLERDESRAEIQNLLKTITDNADQFAVAGKILEQERDEARTKSDRLQGLIDDLLDEPTARQVQQMLRTWVTELDWSAGCFDSSGREQIDTIQKTLVAAIERIEGMVNPEGGTDGE